MELTTRYPLRLGSVTHVGIAALSSFGIAVLYVIDPRVPGNYPVCPFLSLTGCYCPGCGTLRALYQLMHADVVGALGYNPLAVLSLPFIIYSLTTSALRKVRAPAPRPAFIHPRWIWVLLVGIVVFWVLRNVPVAPFTALVP